MSLIGALLLLPISQAMTGPTVVVKLTNGKSFSFVTDQVHSPKTTAGILKLVKSGFYSKIRIHRVEDFVVQWGDPLSKQTLDDPRVGSGTSGTPLPFERSPVSFSRGVVGIASTGAGRGGDCQLFILKIDSPMLNNDYAVLGKVVSGMNVIDGIKAGDQIASMTVATAAKKRK